MRVVLIIACATAFMFSVWSNIPTVADAKQAGGSITPVTMMMTAADLPAEQFDAY